MVRKSSQQPSSFTIAIVGGGFSGAVLASELLRSGPLALRVVLVERDGCPGRGVAYGTRCEGHLLNVRARDMSALASDPSHFLRWAREHYRHQAQPDDYLPRSIYGDYVESTLCETVEQNPGRFEWKHDEALSATRGEGANVLFKSGDRIHADAVVLALGNFPPNHRILPGRSVLGRRFVMNPWAVHALDGIDPEESVLLIGSGLTSVDTVISLRACGFPGKIHMISRHGFLPQAHKPIEPRLGQWTHFPARLRSLLRLIRAEVTRAESENGDWRAVIDSIRPCTHNIWHSLSQTERRRFLRHLRAYWDVHRHRVAPEIGRLLETEMDQGRLEIHSGRITDCLEDARSVKVSYRRRGSRDLKTLSVGFLVNCTGPDEDCRRVTSPLLMDLLRQKLARPDPLFLGLDTAEHGALLDDRGVPSDFLYALGPLRKGNLWESTAVPEIRAQASELALHLRSRFEPRYLESPVSGQAALS